MSKEFGYKLAESSVQYLTVLKWDTIKVSKRDTISSEVHCMLAEFSSL